RMVLVGACTRGKHEHANRCGGARQDGRDEGHDRLLGCASGLAGQRRRGFNASRSQSPNRLMLSAISTSVAPGKITSHQAPLKSCLLPSLMNVPRDGEVGETPTPRNDSVASARMATATWIV